MPLGVMPTGERRISSALPGGSVVAGWHWCTERRLGVRYHFVLVASGLGLERETQPRVGYLAGFEANDFR
jgi:hypothetical protein